MFDSIADTVVILKIKSSIDPVLISTNKIREFEIGFICDIELFAFFAYLEIV
jgi:hypothetical protein